MDLNDRFEKVKRASMELAALDEEVIDRGLLMLADSMKSQESIDYILRENARDLELMDDSNPKKDRLRLTPQRIQDIANGIADVASLPSPVGRVLRETTHPNGMRIKKVSVPFGVIGVIYEARPNVSSDVFSLCFKSRNGCVLKGGSDAICSNTAIVDIIHRCLMKMGINPDIVELLPPGHESATELMNATRYVDLIIPRGGSGLINYVRQNSKVAVIETGAGICHTYFDLNGKLEYGIDIVKNAKMRRVSVCNALDCLIVHSGRLDDLYSLVRRMGEGEKRVTIYADERAYKALDGKYLGKLEHATEESFGTEFLDYKMAIKCVDSPEEALEHIGRYSSRHSECIVTEDMDMAQRFVQNVDAACVYVNVPTSFTDGAQFGLGAEIGISTQKLHARGPMGLEEITTYKWIIEGEGQTRP